MNRIDVYKLATLVFINLTTVLLLVLCYSLSQTVVTVSFICVIGFCELLRFQCTLYTIEDFERTEKLNTVVTNCSRGIGIASSVLTVVAVIVTLLTVY